MTRQEGEEDLTDRQVEILDIAEDWHFAGPGDEALNYSLTEWLAYKLDITEQQAMKELYDEHIPNDGNYPDGAQV